MKKLLALTLIAGLTLSGCTTKDASTVDTSATTTAETETEATAQAATEVATETTTEEVPLADAETTETIDAMGDVEVDKGLLTVELVMPAEYMEGVTQEALDASTQENGFISATLNEDGSVTYVMTKDTHSKFMEEFKTQLATALNEMVGSTDYPNITSIETNDDYTEFNVTTTSTELSMNESFSVMAFYMYGGMYNIFNGTKTDSITVNFINADSGEIINSSNSADLE